MSTSLSRAQADLFYRVMLAVSQNDTSKIAAFKRDPQHLSLLRMALSARNRCDGKKVERLPTSADEAKARKVDECIVNLVGSGAWSDKLTGFPAVVSQTGCTINYASERYKRLAKAGKIAYSASLRRAVVLYEVADGPRP